MVILAQKIDEIIYLRWIKKFFAVFLSYLNVNKDLCIKSYINSLFILGLAQCQFYNFLTAKQVAQLMTAVMSCLYMINLKNYFHLGCSSGVFFLSTVNLNAFSFA